MSEIDTLSAHLQIRNLYSHYSFAFDGDDPEDMANCFTQEATWDSGLHGHFEGRDSIKGIVEMAKNFGSRRPYHLTMNVIIRQLEGDTANCSARFMLVENTLGPTAFGQYNDVIVKESDGAWRIKHRQLVEIWRHPASISVNKQ